MSSSPADSQRRREKRYWIATATMPLVLPMFGLLVLSMAGVGPVDGASVGGLGLAALLGSVTFGLPPYGVLLLVLLLMLRREHGGRAVRRWLWVAPFLYLAVFWAMWAVLFRTVPLDGRSFLIVGGIAFAVACGYAILAALGWSVCVRRHGHPRGETPEPAME